ncbi:hypothetical protein QEN19_000046 [Hanseniaspora menglaensis]
MFAAIVDFILSIPKPDLDGRYEEFTERYLLNKVSFLNKTYISHLHKVFYVAVSYHLLFLFSFYILQPLLSNLLIKKEDKEAIARDAKKKKRNQVAMHIVSFIQALCILEFCFKAIYKDMNYYFTFVTLKNNSIYSHSLSNFGWESFKSQASERLFGYTDFNEKIAILACGYFLWDMAISAYCSTPAFMVHGVVSFTVYSIGLSGFINYYAAVFLIFELSNPFLNIRWFANHYKLSDSKLAQLNEIIFMSMFFICRIVWGLVQMGVLVTDFVICFKDPRFHKGHALIITLGNGILDILNLYWFMIMLKIARKRIFGGKKIINKKVE